MSKPSRRKRKKLEMKFQSQEVIVTAGEANEKKKRSKKKHICIFHQYQEVSDGTYVCKYCGHHFKRRMDEKELSYYFQNRTEFSLKELQDMDYRLLKVTFGRNTRGVVTEYEAEELTGSAAIREVFEFWDCFRFIKDDLSIDPSINYEIMPKTHLPWIEDGSLLQKAIEDGLDMKLFQNFRWWCDKNDPHYNERKWVFRDQQFNIICYWMNVIYCDVYPASWELFYSCIPDPVMVIKCVLNSECCFEKLSIYLRNGEIYSLTR